MKPNLVPLLAALSLAVLHAVQAEDTLVLDADVVKNLRLKTAEVAAADFDETVLALGRVEVRPGHRAVVSSRIAGRAVTVNALPDHAVSEGEPLVVVESRLAGEPPPRVTLNAPMSGWVASISIAPGEPVSPDRALLEIVNLDSVYAVAQVPEHFAARIKPGQTARIRVAGWPDSTWTATLEHVGVMAERDSGTLEAAFFVDNADHRLRPGMLAEFSIVTGGRAGVTAVPRAALQGDAASRFVYVVNRSAPNMFVKAPVETGVMNDGLVEITRGLAPGARVVTQGAYSLAFAGDGGGSLKEALDAAHGHAHNPDGSEISPGEDDHGHGGDGGPLSPLTLASLIGNAVLLAALILLAVLRRGSAPSTD